MLVKGLLIDTDVLSFVAWGKPRARAFEPLLLGRLPFVSFVTVGEMYFGAVKANWGERRVAKMETMLGRYTVIPGDSNIAMRYGEVRKAFDRQVESNDKWIAATALAHDLEVVTNNLAHFVPMSERLGFSLVHPDRR
ncbi:MAG: PIN domain-containing protein [Acidimicrobiaceae bacterium]|nr:PIN domain-containing protein [Acidimicrobiaceae bacterium]